MRPSGKRFVLCMAVLAFAMVALFALCLFGGTVDIPVSETWAVLCGGEASKNTWTHIVWELRIPLACTAVLCGAALAVAGLLLQTIFNNPLAGPSILGVTTGSSLGVAVALLAGIGLGDARIAAIGGASVGALVVVAALLLMSAIVRSTMGLLIVGILLGYVASSAISLLNFYATQEGVHSFVIWGMGNFGGVNMDDLPLFGGATCVLIGLSLLLIKPLNAFLLGERQAASLGISVRATRNTALLISGLLAAVVTAFCGPIGFLGLIVPHIARLVLNTSDHSRVLPATILAGAVLGLLTLYISTLPADKGMLPVNAVTPLLGVPVVLYIIVFRKQIRYFN